MPFEQATKNTSVASRAAAYNIPGVGPGLKLSGDEQIGVNIIRRACEEPLRQIVQNAGLEGSIVVEKVRSSKDVAYGFNAESNQYVDMVKSGIIDPTKVERVALQHAASIASWTLKVSPH